MVVVGRTPPQSAQIALLIAFIGFVSHTCTLHNSNAVLLSGYRFLWISIADRQALGSRKNSANCTHEENSNSKSATQGDFFFCHSLLLQIKCSIHWKNLTYGLLIPQHFPTTNPSLNCFILPLRGSTASPTTWAYTYSRALHTHIRSSSSMSRCRSANTQRILNRKNNRRNDKTNWNVRIVRKMSAVFERATGDALNASERTNEWVAKENYHSKSRNVNKQKGK